MPAATFGSRVRLSPYFDRTIAAGATAFTTYNHMHMPSSYGDPEAEYHRLMYGVAMWDVAAERQVQLQGPGAAELADHLSARDLSSLKVGQARYAPMCDYSGILINDPVVLRISDDTFWFSIADGDIALWAKGVAGAGGFDVAVTEPDVSPLAVQGPLAEDVVAALIGEWVRELRYFGFRETTVDNIPVLVCRSGWSKQGGFELFLTDSSRGGDLWDLVAAAGEPFGIGPGTPNQMERIESCLLSFGSDTDDDTDPIEAGLGAFITLDGSDFVGKTALLGRLERPNRRTLVGVRFDTYVGPNVEPISAATCDGRAIGSIRNITLSERFGHSIGLALIHASSSEPGTAMIANTPEGPTVGYVATLPFE